MAQHAKIGIMRGDALPLPISCGTCMESGKNDITSSARTGCGNGRFRNECAMLKAALKHTREEKWLLNGRSPLPAPPPPTAIADGATRLGVDEVGESENDRGGVGSCWKVALQPQLGDVDVVVLLLVDWTFVDLRSQCFLGKTGKSEKAQYLWSLILALRRISKRCDFF